MVLEQQFYGKTKPTVWKGFSARRTASAARLETADKQPAALGLYRRHGFAEVPRIPPYTQSATSVGMQREMRRAPMSVFDHAEYEPSPWEPIAQEVALYEETNGSVPSQLVGDQWIVFWTLGAKSGKVRKTPVVRVTDGERYAVIGSMGGAPTHPRWVHNLRANPVARVQDGATRHDCRAEELTGEAKAEWWARANVVWPDYDTYQEGTDREIPLFLLSPV